MIEGLSTYSALTMLNNELKIILKKNYMEKNIFHYFILSLKIGILKYFLIANILVLFLLFSELFYRFLLDKRVYFWNIALFCTFLAITIMNLILICYGTKSRCSSIYKKFQLLIDDIQHIMESNCEGWSSVANYPFVKIPFANSVNLQWTIRDNQLINLPVALLVKGDKINLRPGQYIFADCEIINETIDHNKYEKTYTIGQTFVANQEKDTFDKKHFCDKSNHTVIPMKGCVTAVVTKTPIVGLIEDFIVNHSQKKLWMITVPERYLQFSVNALLVYVLIVFILNSMIHIIWFILVGYNKNMKWSSTISHIFLIGLPLQLPILLSFTLSNIIWKINCLRFKLDRRATLISTTVSMESIPSSLSSSSSDSNKSGPVDVTMEPMPVSCIEYIRAHWNQIINQDNQFANMIYSMGSLTSLCCVDKKGILAEPIATPEKIFIYRRKHRHKSSSLINLDRSNRKNTQDNINTIIMNSINFDHLTNARLRSITANSTITSLDLNTNQIESCISDKQHSTCSQFKNEQMIPLLDMNCSLAVPVILDMTRSNTHPYLPSFDDSRWERYISSLKPIGLNILLNNCNPDVTDRYINFTDNMSAINFKNLNKSQLMHRCICALATQIGFKSSATDRFTLDSTFAVCQKYEKSIENSATNNYQVYSLPVGNVFSTVVKDSIQNNYQLMSQGSADLLMSMCSDYWDGKDISPLTAYDRSRVLDFYNRNIFSSYCIAFAYSPLFNKITLNGLEDQFILQMFDNKEKRIKFDANFSQLNHFYTSSMPFTTEHSEMPHLKSMTSQNMKITNQTLMKSEEIKSLLHHQIFLGMISLQADQVQSDVIDCINRLEQACIRFVFFSTDNQLRSRVFAERLGMESGWNCHISLAENDVVNNKHNPNLRRTSSKGNKTFLPEEILKENHPLKRIYSSEPTLSIPLYETEQITHSTTLNEKNFYVPLKYENDEFKNDDDLDFNANITDGGNTSSTSTTLDTGNRQSSYMENPHDHFPEDKSKLPCGIKSIRPHLEEVDNVPLQVSLFTDCNPEVDQEMMNIMREYGEIICCCGSGLTVKNVPLFASNDCAVAFVPILHKQCWRQHELKSSDVTVLSKGCYMNKKDLIEEEPMLKKKSVMHDHMISFPELSPINIACRLVALPCGLLLNRKTGFDLIAFITECHRLVKNTLSSVAFYCLSCASFVILKFFFNISILIFDLYHTNGNFHLNLDIFPIDSQIIYHFYFHTPVLALVIYSRLTMLGKPLKEPPRKRGRLLTYKQCYRFIIASLGRFIPSTIICIITLIWNLFTLCPIDRANSSKIIETFNYTEEYTKSIPVVFSDFIFVQHNLYIIVISFAFISPEKPFWKFNFFKNYLWLMFAFLLTLVQIGYLLVSWKMHSYPDIYSEIWKNVKLPLILSCNGVFVVLLIGFLANYWELRLLSVEHRLARLYFGTKLGMYSPV